MRRAARVDANQAEIVEALRAAGVSVLVLSQLGRGTPDLLLGTHMGNLLLEVKDGAKPPSARKLTPDEERFFSTWRGPKAVVHSTATAFEALTANGLWRPLEDRPRPVAYCPRDPGAGTSASSAPPKASGG